MAIAVTAPDAAPARRFDRVAAFGALLAFAGATLLPFVEFRANRIVAGATHGLSAGGAAGFALAALAALSLAAAFAPARSRASLELAGASAMTAVLAWALGYAASTLTRSAPAIARVSVGGGPWLAGAGVAIVWFAALQARPGRAVRWAAAGVAALAWAAAAAWGGLARLSLVMEYRVQADAFWSAVATHLSLVGVSLGIAVLVGVPLGVAAARVRWVRSVLLPVVGVIQTIPSLALLGLLVVPLAVLGLPGIGPLPATIALTAYALLPVVRDTYIGLAGVDPAAVDAGRGMGMTPTQLLLRVEAPLALPLMVEGVRSATVMIIGIAAVVAFVGVGTLGVLVFSGWGYQADDLILLGAVPMVLLALVADAGLRWLGRALTSPGVR